MSTKNPFEIRLELLKMAKEMAEQSFYEQSNRATQMIENAADYQHKNITEMTEYFENISPEMFTTDDVSYLK